MIDDLADHAQQVASVLRPEGRYDTVTCHNSGTPRWSKWRPKISPFSNVPVPDHSVQDISAAFRKAGFEVSINQFLANAFLPKDAEHLDVYTNWKLCFRRTKPAQ